MNPKLILTDGKVIARAHLGWLYESLACCAVGQDENDQEQEKTGKLWKHPANGKLLYFSIGSI